MAMASDLTDFYPLMFPELPEIETPLALQELQRAMRDFCNETEAWVVDLEPIDIVADQRAYSLYAKFDARIQRVKQVNVLSDEDVTNDTDGQEFDRNLYKFTQPAELKFISGGAPNTAVTDGLIVKVVQTPFLMTTDMDEDFLNRWAEPIVARAMFLLMKMPGKAWTDEARANYYHSQYRLGKGKAKDEVDRKNLDDFQGVKG